MAANNPAEACKKSGHCLCYNYNWGLYNRTWFDFFSCIPRSKHVSMEGMSESTAGICVMCRMGSDIHDWRWLSPELADGDGTAGIMLAYLPKVMNGKSSPCSNQGKKLVTED